MGGSQGGVFILFHFIFIFADANRQYPIQLVGGYEVLYIFWRGNEAMTTKTTTTGASRQQQCSRRRIWERQFSESFEIPDFESFSASWSLDETVAIFGHLNAHPKKT